MGGEARGGRGERVRERGEGGGEKMISDLVLPTLHSMCMIHAMPCHAMPCQDHLLPARTGKHLTSKTAGMHGVVMEESALGGLGQQVEGERGALLSCH